MSDAIADVLDDAADLLERGRWIRGVLADGEGGYCAEGAIAHVSSGVCTPEVFVTTPTGLAAERRLWHTIGEPIPDWNDTPGRTKQQVLDAFRLAAKRERMDGAA